MVGEIQHWFGRVLDLPPASRLDFLEANCRDTAVRAEVASLLRYDVTASAAAPLDRVVRRAVGLLAADDDGPPVPRVGPFELGRLLGSGGMGAVYEGVRVDGEVRQRVAVKFASVSPVATPEARRAAYTRFLREREALASLRHPYIAGLIDAGATADGVPYAVIEEVDGRPIDAYSDAAGLDRLDRVRLAVKLCEAVQFAHSRLIVHSDIKPDNVLITDDGIPKLIDFGVANNLNDGEAPDTAVRAFTPGYASPEQCLGAPATVATDVYGIGAVLYRLLTGARPREAAGPIGDVIRRVSEEDVVRPSAIQPGLKGDLENILLKALHRDPHCRYGSVPELRDDLNRYLAHRPVRATPDSTAYRLRRFVRRQWAPVIAAASVALLLTAATAVSLRQKGIAAERAVKARKLADRLLFEIHDEIDTVVGGTKARERLGTIAAQYLEGLQRDDARDPELAWELLNAYSRLGQSRGGAASSIGDTESGILLARRALELGAVVERSSPSTDRLDRLFGIYEGLCPMLQDARRPDLQREAIGRLLRLAPRLQPIRQAQAWKEQARYFEWSGAPRESAEAFERALAVLRPLAAEGSAVPGAAGHLISTLVGLGRAQARSGDPAGAIAPLTEAVQRAESSLQSDPHSARVARQLYWSHLTLGDALAAPFAANLGRTVEGIDHYDRARRIAEELLRADPANEAVKLDLARALARAGLTLSAEDPARSLALFDRVRMLNLKTSFDCIPGVECRLACLTGSVEPLIRLGQVEQAKSNAAEARRLVADSGPARGSAAATRVAGAEVALRLAEAPAEPRLTVALARNVARLGKHD